MPSSLGLVSSCETEPDYTAFHCHRCENVKLNYSFRLGICSVYCEYGHSDEGKRPKNGRMEQQKAMEYGSRKA
jgi:hypothetical protein